MPVLGLSAAGQTRRMPAAARRMPEAAVKSNSTVRC
jgi:hypothetical protein